MYDVGVDEVYSNGSAVFVSHTRSRLFLEGIRCVGDDNRRKSARESPTRYEKPPALGSEIGLHSNFRSQLGYNV